MQSATRPRATAVAGPIALVAAGLTLAGCSLPHRHADLPAPTGAAYRPVAAAVPATDGAIYAAGRETTYFEDLKAHRKGDLITIRLQEATNASKSSSTDTAKDSSATLASPTILGKTPTWLDTGVDGKRAFKGTGNSSQQNALTGSITAVVAEVLPNGNLVVEGEKWLRLNQGDELVKVRGVVRPFDVLADNSVTSDRVADARISYAGRGALASSNTPGWLTRFFSSPLFPY